jgi:hypothetical protein
MGVSLDDLNEFDDCRFLLGLGQTWTVLNGKKSVLIILVEANMAAASQTGNQQNFHETRSYSLVHGPRME